ncbi:MAG: FHA domain-containing protein [Anaerolineaceae bacterium]|nr:MAG: FHA domain-containing protein [Anaerolineaceae bacterium]
MAYLVMRRGPEPGRVYPFDEFHKTEIRLGRGNQNDIIIQDNDVSRDHVAFQRANDGYKLRDLKSSNGTFINGKRVDGGGMWLLRSRCTIELGEAITLEYYPGELDEQARLAGRRARVHLVVTVAGEPEPTTYVLGGNKMSVGRSNMCDVTIIAPEVSRQHLELEPHPKGYILRDLNSTNGTLLNDVPVTEEHMIKMGDIIRIGDQITMQLTDRPHRFSGRSTTDLLIDTRELQAVDDPSKRHSTDEREVPLAVIDEAQMTFAYPVTSVTDMDEDVLRDSVLIAYDRTNWRSLVAPLVDKLMGAEINTWTEQHLSEGSHPWLTSNHQARQSCWMLLIVVTPETLKRDVVRSHLGHFRNREKPIIALIYEPLERTPPNLKNVPCIHYNPALPDDTFRHVINEIRKVQKLLHG